MARSIAGALFCLGLASLGSLTAAAKEDSHTRVTYPSALTLEVIGRAGLGSINFDQVLSDDLAAGLGLGTAPLQTAAGASANSSATLLPIYANYYFMRESGSAFVTFGADVILNSTTTRNLVTSAGGFDLSNKSVLPVVGVGFEKRTDTGYLFRMTGYGVFAGTFKVWAGGSFGLCF